MSDPLMTPDHPPVTRSELAAALHQAGVRAGGILMVHTRMSAIGWVVGGEDTVVLALRDALGIAVIVELADPGTIPRSEGKAVRVLDHRAR